MKFLSGDERTGLQSPPTDSSVNIGIRKFYGAVILVQQKLTSKSNPAGHPIPLSFYAFSGPS